MAKLITSGSIVASLLKRKEGKEYSKKQSKIIQQLTSLQVIYMERGELVRDVLANVYPLEGEWERNSDGAVLPLDCIQGFGYSAVLNRMQYSDQDMDCALCIFEELTSASSGAQHKQKHNLTLTALESAVADIQAAEGIQGIRALTIAISKPIQDAWCNCDLTENYDGAFDWDFIPALLLRAAERENLKVISAKDWSDLVNAILGGDDIQDTPAPAPEPVDNNDTGETWDKDDLAHAVAAGEVEVLDVTIKNGAGSLLPHSPANDNPDLMSRVTRAKEYHDKKRLDALRNATIAINAAHACKALESVVQAIGADHLGELADVGGIDIRETIKALKLISETWSDSLNG